jgi:hypothetical protein
MTVPANLLRAFDAIYGYIGAARDIVHAGQMPDMMGLDRRVSELCASIELSEPDVRQECLPKLDLLLQKLDECEADIRASRAKPAKDKVQS